MILGKEGFDLLEDHKIPIIPTHMISNEEEAEKLPIPCVMKVLSISHKTEKNAVRIVRCKDELIDTYLELSELGEVFWQPFVEGVETIIGLKKDPAFGRVIMFGLGGIFTELFKDVSFRVCPVTSKDASEMMAEIKGYELLKGWRGKEAVNFKLLNEVIVKVSNLTVSELDINPFIINSKEGFAVDVRAIE